MYTTSSLKLSRMTKLDSSDVIKTYLRKFRNEMSKNRKLSDRVIETTRDKSDLMFKRAISRPRRCYTGRASHGLFVIFPQDSSSCNYEDLQTGSAPLSSVKAEKTQDLSSTTSTFRIDEQCTIPPRQWADGAAEVQKRQDEKKADGPSST